MNIHQMKDRVRRRHDLNEVRKAFNHAFMTWRMYPNDVAVQQLVPAFEWVNRRARKHNYPLRKGVPLGTITLALERVA